VTRTVALDGAPPAQRTDIYALGVVAETWEVVDTHRSL